jgi:putative phosphoesterase
MEALEQAELIVHTGDLFGLEVLEAILEIGPPVVAVRGNVDQPAVVERLEPTAEFEHRGARIAVIHDAGPRKGRLARMRARFPAAGAVIFGHSHMPLHESDENGFQIFNPGSPTERRRADRASFGLAEVDSKGRPAFEHVWL